MEMTYIFSVFRSFTGHHWGSNNYTHSCDCCFSIVHLDNLEVQELQVYPSPLYNVTFCMLQKLCSAIPICICSRAWHIFTLKGTTRCKDSNVTSPLKQRRRYNKNVVCLKNLSINLSFLQSLDQNYTPIDLHKHKKLSISLSIRTNNDYYEITADSVSSPIITTPLHGEAQQSQSVDNVSKLPLAHTNIIKNTDAMSPDKTNSSWTSLPPMAHSQNENTDPGTVSTELSNNQEEPAGIVFQPSSGIENGRGEQLITSGIGFEFTDTKSSSETESSFNFPVDISESEVLPTNLPDSSNIQDSEITKGQTDGAPLSETGYTNVPETISPLSPKTPSDVTLAFATMSQPAGPFKQSGPDYESQLDRESGSERSPVYVNSGSSEDEGQYTAKSASSYIDELTTHYMAESSLGKSSTTGYITESSMIISSSDYVKGSSEGKSSVDYVGNTGEGQSFYDRSLGGDLSSTYISESDLGNGHMRSFEPLPNDKARLPGTTQFMSDHDSSSASQVNSGSLGYIILDDLNTSSTT